MNIGVPRETQPGETRVALTPQALAPLLRDGHAILIQSGAGEAAHFSDARYMQAGARIIADAPALYAQADVIFKAQPPWRDPASDYHEADSFREGTMCVGLLAPLTRPDVTAIFARRHITSYALELLPRVARAQSMDALTAMATVAGYKAVLLAADRLDKFFPLLMTAAGTIAPANILVLGVGVAGLQAIATAKRLGARVTAFDPRPAVREQVESLGASFLAMPAVEQAEPVETAGGYAREQSDTFLQAERACIAEQLAKSDVVICAAQVYGKRAPILITADMAPRLRPGGVIVDLAADQGGNCELTQPDREIEHDGALIIGAGNLPALVPADASRMYAHNLVNFFRYLYPAHGTPPDQTDEIAHATCVTRAGAIVSDAARAAVAVAAKASSVVAGAKGA